MLGVCPENCITYPRVNKIYTPAKNELTKGHDYLFLMNNEGDLTDAEEDEGDVAL